MTRSRMTAAGGERSKRSTACSAFCMGSAPYPRRPRKSIRNSHIAGSSSTTMTRMGSGMEFADTRALGAGLKGGTHHNTHLDLLFSKQGATRERWVRFAENGEEA